MRWRWTCSGTAREASAAGTRRRARVRSAERTGSNQMASRVPPTRGPRRGGPDRARRSRRVPRIGRTRAAGLVAAARVMAAGRVDVHAADNVPGAGAEHRVGEPAAPGEVLCVPLQVAQIVTQRHLVRPAAVREPRRRPDMVHAARPGGVIGLVVLRPERGQPEFPGYEPVGYREVFRNEQLIAHPAIVTRLRRQTLRGAAGSVVPSECPNEPAQRDRRRLLAGHQPAGRDTDSVPCPPAGDGCRQVTTAAAFY